MVLLAVLGLAYQMNRTTGEIPPKGAIFTVTMGETLGDISARLQEANLIKSDLFLKSLSLIKGTQTAFQRGSYRIVENATTLMIHDLLVEGIEVLEEITVPEGLPLSRVALIFEDAGIAEAAEIVDAAGSRALLDDFGIPADTAEGYLFPDTYHMPKDYPADAVVRFLIAHFFEILSDIHPSYDSLTPQELHNAVILASIVEREYLEEEDAPLIASVFYNRLTKRMRLQSCATVAYVLTEEKGLTHPERLTYADLEVSSLYNTYRHGGVPPGPIANPGSTALSAVFFPADSPFLYFVLKNPDTGEHEFTETLDAHISAKNLFLKKS